jgi:ATP phosphoribosyltransferase regulatory subunit
MSQQVPKGLRDLLPEDVKKERLVLGKIRAVFEKAGYERIITPTFEYYASLAPALSEDLKNQAYKFLDDEGKLLMLRVDHTTPIARVAATRMAAVKKPIRLYYSGDVFRKGKLTAGQDSQFHQIGVELLGVSGKSGDTEILAVAQKALQAVGLKNFKIHSTSVQKIQKLPPIKRQALFNQDFVALGRLPKPDELLVTHHDYYSGLMFEIYVPELGYVIGNVGTFDPKNPDITKST